tara:strand:- start:519 stop:710 length:192 start_codon:yes stop_codon:yes gene_type:complete
MNKEYVSEPVLTDEEIRLLLLTLDSCVFPEELWMHPSKRSRSIHIRAERKLKAIQRARENTNV